MEHIKAYVQHGTSGTPMRTEEVEVKTDPLRHHTLGLSYTASGYGAKLPTVFKVFYQGRWYRVYSVCFSNVSTEYIISKGEKLNVAVALTTH